MKIKVWVTIAIGTFIILLTSCVSIHDRQMSVQERVTANVVGSVSVDFVSFQFLHIRNNNGLRSRAHRELMNEARRRFGSNVEIRNVDISGSFSGFELLKKGSLITIGTIVDLSIYGDFGEAILIGGGMGLVASTLLGNFQRITAIGDVVLLGGEQVRPPMAQQRLDNQINLLGLDGAIARAFGTLILELPQDTTLAILNINAANISDAEYVIDMLEFRFVQSRRFRMVDRHRLAQILREQEFHLSGFVDDDSAISIGNLLGASIVITGNVANNRLVLRALDVQTAQIMTMALEQF